MSQYPQFSSELSCFKLLTSKEEVGNGQDEEEEGLAWLGVARQLDR